MGNEVAALLVEDGMMPNWTLIDNSTLHADTPAYLDIQAALRDDDELLNVAGWYWIAADNASEPEPLPPTVAQLESECWRHEHQWVEGNDYERDEDRTHTRGICSDIPKLRENDRQTRRP